MKTWFPFTDYDFYGYLASGIVLLFAIDYWLTGGTHTFLIKWTIQQVVFATALAYVAGQIIAIPSSLLLEHILARKLMTAPIAVQMNKKANLFTRLMSCIVGRGYTPLPTAICTKVLERAVLDTGLTEAELLSSPENIFHPAHNACRAYDANKTRLDDFRNQYGFHRNMALTGLISTILMTARAMDGVDCNAKTWAILSLIMGIGMLIRFLKFYSEFSAEVLRGYAFGKRD